MRTGFNDYATLHDAAVHHIDKGDKEYCLSCGELKTLKDSMCMDCREDIENVVYTLSEALKRERLLRANDRRKFDLELDTMISAARAAKNRV